MGQAVKPFKATHYNRSLLNDFLKVACPPYDVIDKKKAISLKKRSPYNYCRISLAEGKDYDKPAENLKKWLEKKVLIDDCRQNYYLYRQKFKAEGKTFSRYGIFCLLNMEKKDIFPHEHTLAEPKKDRKKMIDRLKANLSPVFVIAKNDNFFLISLFKKYAREKPFCKFIDDEGNLNCFWKIIDAGEITKISSSLEDASLVIADGHHRFETSFNYFKKNKGKFKDLNYILSYLTVLQPGLLILPTHRIISSSVKSKINFERLKNDFQLKPAGPKELKKKLKAAKEFCFGLYWNKKFYFATLQNKGILGTILPSVYRKIDTYVFHKYVLPKISYKEIKYTHSIDQAKKITKNNDMAFLLKAITLDAVFDVVKSGHRLPQKSTYFYPKVPSGLVLRRFKK